MVTTRDPVTGQEFQDGAGEVLQQGTSTWQWPANLWDTYSGDGTNAADVMIQTTDSTDANEHALHVTVGAVDVTVSLDGTNYAPIFVENLDSAGAAGTRVDGTGLAVGLYRFFGKFRSIKVVQNGATAATAFLGSYAKGA